MPTTTLEQIIEAIADALECPSYPVDLEWGDFECADTNDDLEDV